MADTGRVVTDRMVLAAFEVLSEELQFPIARVSNFVSPDMRGVERTSAIHELQKAEAACLADSLSLVRRALEAAASQSARLLSDEEVIERLAAEVERLTDALHRRRAHPDYEYATTTCGRKAGPAPEPEGDGWERNEWGGDWHSSWERFDYHEDHYWRRLTEAPQ